MSMFGGSYRSPQRNSLMDALYGYPQPQNSPGNALQIAQLIPGNIDLYNRPQVKNSDGSISTVRSISFGTDEGEVVVPTVSEDGRIMSDEEAIEQYYRTGRHLGIFKTTQEAEAFAKRLHDQQDQHYLRRK